MHDIITRWLRFFQGLILTRFRNTQKEAIEILIWLITGHLFGLYNPNQFAQAFEIPKVKLYEHLTSFSPDQWRKLLLEMGCQKACKLIAETESMSGATQSRRRITLSVDDTVQDREGKLLSYCYHWYSGRVRKTLAGQNIVAVTLKIGDIVLPLGLRLVSKQGRGNTEKPQILIDLMGKIVDFFTQQGITITDYPITFDSWYGSQPLREDLEKLGFSQILVHAKSNYVFEIDDQKAKLSVHKQRVELDKNQWGCDKPSLRVQAISPTFGQLILLFFRDCGQLKCMMVFNNPLRGCEILSIWRQHHGIEQFWRNLKSIVYLKAMRLRGRGGAYAGVGIKVLAYLLLIEIRMATGQTPHQTILAFSGQRERFWEIIEHFHSSNTQDH